MKEVFTIVILTENKVGLLNRITALFIQRHINIESITASESEYEGIHRYTIVIQETLEQTQKVAKQIEKQVEVLKAFFFKDEETIFSEIALYKVELHNNREELMELIGHYKAYIKEEVDDFLVIEKTGKKQETHDLFEALKPFKIHGFVRSGRISLSKGLNTFSAYLNELEKHSKETIT